jgi:hypothetical protein
MAKRNRGKEFWQAQKEQRIQRERARKHRARVLRILERKPDRAQAGKPDLHRSMADIHSTDEAIRGQAVRNLCPCRIGWDGFQEGMEAIARMQKDRSPEVRGQALHVFEDAYQQDREAFASEGSEGSEAIDREREKSRQAKKAMTAALRRPYRPHRPR